MDAPPEKKGAAPDQESRLFAELTVGNVAAVEAARKARIIEAVRDYMRHGHSDFEARRIRTMGAALRKGRK